MIIKEEEEETLGQLRDRLGPGLARGPAPGPRATFVHIKVEDTTSGEDTDAEGDGMDGKKATGGEADGEEEEEGEEDEDEEEEEEEDEEEEEEEEEKEEEEEEEEGSTACYDVAHTVWQAPPRGATSEEAPTAIPPRGDSHIRFATS